MFNLTELENFVVKDWPVTFNKPVAGGKVEEVHCTADWQLVTEDELLELTKDDPFAAIKHCLKAVGGMSQTDSNGDEQPLIINKESIEQLMNHAFITVGLNASLYSALGGIQQDASSEVGKKKSATDSQALAQQSEQETASA